MVRLIKDGISIENDKVILSFQEEILSFENVSKNFGVDYNQAILIAEKQLGDRLKEYYNGNDFIGEGYLKILTQQNGDSGQLFWVFTVVSRNNLKNNVVMSVEDGNIIIND